MSDKRKQVFDLLDEINKEDPNSELLNGQSFPKELLYSERMTKEQERFTPNCSDELAIACRAQHVKRWSVPRDSYPEGKKGYYDWRTYLYSFHSNIACESMRKVGYSEEACETVTRIMSKKDHRKDSDSQTYEDIICLVFLQYYLADFAQKHPEDKLISIIQKTWKKMSDKGHEAALKITLPDEMAKLVQKALS